MERPWLKFYDPHVPPNIEYPKILLPQILDEAADFFPGKTAVFFFGGRLNYAPLRVQANQFASALRRMGFQKGDRLGLLLANMPQAIISTFGTLKAGGIVFFFDPLAEEEELREQFVDAGVETAVVLDLIFPRVERILGQGQLKYLIVTGVQDYLPFPRNFFFSLAAKGRGMNVKVARKPNLFPFKEFLLTGRSNFSNLTGMPADPEEVAVVQYTKGSSGPAKGVVLSHRNLMASLFQMAAWMGKWERGRGAFLSIPPFHQPYGLTLAMNLPIHLAAVIVPLPRFDVQQALSLIRKHRLSFFPAWHSMIESLSYHPEAAKSKVSPVKISWSIGEPLLEEHLHKFEQRIGGKVSEGFGLAEASALTHANPIFGKRKVGSIGLPLPDTEAKIVDTHSGEKEVPVGASGELVIKGPQVMPGYWNRPEETRKTLRQGWLHTGYMARMDEDGFFYLAGQMSPKA